jgi:hypothetical protein
MSWHLTFNQSWLSRFLNRPAGRAFRVAAGVAFLAAGYLFRESTLGVASMVWGILPLSAGGFDVCYVSAALGGPLSGAAIRSQQTQQGAAR